MSTASQLKLYQDHSPDTHREAQGEYRQAFSVLNDYIRHTDFKRILNRIVTVQAERELRGISVISQHEGEGKSFFVSALALAYTRYLYSRVLIVETIRQTKSRSLYLECLFGEPLADSEPGYIDLVSTESFNDGDFDMADFQIGAYLKKAQQSYDLVLLDTCSLDNRDRDNLDPMIVSSYVDGAILLTSPKSRDSMKIKGTCKQLEEFGVHLLGTVFNPGAGK